MKIALIHDYLNQYGGGERVLEVLMEMFPDAPIYTLLHDGERTLNRFSNRVKATSFLDFSLARRRHRLFIPLMPMAMKSLKISEQYDLIISDSAGFAKGFEQKPKTFHVSYIHTPLRYAWEQEYYLANIISKPEILISKPILNYLKKWDFDAAQKPDILIANSNFIAEKIKKYYQRDVAKVIYPPVDTLQFYRDPELHTPNAKSYYLAAGRLLHYKKFDLVIEAFSKLKLPLKIAGGGPELEKLKNQNARLKAGAEFLGFVSDDELRTLYNGARALIFPQVEDFGLVAAEAQACGAPAIAFAGGGALEIIQDGKTGIFFKEQNSESLAEAVRKFEHLKFDRNRISRIAMGRFAKNIFKDKMLELINGCFSFHEN